MAKILWYQRVSPTPVQEAGTRATQQPAPGLRTPGALSTVTPRHQSDSDQVLALLRDGRVEAGMNLVVERVGTLLG